MSPRRRPAVDVWPVTLPPVRQGDDARQPRLPGPAGAVRDVEIPDARFPLPAADPADFALTAEAGAGQSGRLDFDRDPDADDERRRDCRWAEDPTYTPWTPADEDPDRY